MSDPKARTATVVALARAGIPTDIQELLIAGDPMRGIAPGALDTAITAYLSNLQPSKEVRELVEELRHLVSLNDPSRGGPYAGHAADRCMKAMTRAAAALSRMDGEGWRPKVKALEWKNAWGGSFEDIPEWSAKTPFGSICASVAGHRDADDNRYERHEDVPEHLKEQLITKAEASYTQSILSALAPSIEDPTQ